MIDSLELPQRNTCHNWPLAAGRWQMAEAHCHKQDRYKRHVCLVYVNGEDVALAQLHAGLVWVYRRYLNELPPRYQSEYLSAEDDELILRRNRSAVADLIPGAKALKGELLGELSRSALSNGDRQRNRV